MKRSDLRESVVRNKDPLSGMFVMEMNDHVASKELYLFVPSNGELAGLLAVKDWGLVVPLCGPPYPEGERERETLERL